MTVASKWLQMVCLSSTVPSAIDTSLVLVRADGAPRKLWATRDRVALDQARRTKERRYPELTGEYGRVRLVVLVCEIGGGDRHSGATLLVQTLVHSSGHCWSAVAVWVLMAKWRASRALRDDWVLATC